jgi:hypothetical protein
MSPLCGWRLSGFFSVAIRPNEADVGSQGVKPLDAPHQFTT